MRFTVHTPASYPASRAITCLTVSLLVSGCGMAPGYNSMSTASLRPQPSVGMVQRPYSAYSPASTVGAPMARTAAVASTEGYSKPPRTFKTYQYQWNGNRQRIQAGAALRPATSAPSNPNQVATAGTALQPKASEPISNLTWKATPAAPAGGTDMSGATADKGRATQSKSGATARMAKVQAPAGREIVVGPGDTLYSLATKHDVPMATLMQTNHLNSPVIKVSQHLVLPAASQ